MKIIQIFDENSSNHVVDSSQDVAKDNCRVWRFNYCDVPGAGLIRHHVTDVYKYFYQCRQLPADFQAFKDFQAC